VTIRGCFRGRPRPGSPWRFPRPPRSAG
jgi:hypothetical protein